MLHTDLHDWSYEDVQRYCAAKHREDQFLEYKLEVTGSLSSELCAFANTFGGVIVVGVRESSKGVPEARPIGLADPNAEAERIASMAATGVHPPIFIQTYCPTHEKTGNGFVLVKVHQSATVPHYTHEKGQARIYVRVADQKRFYGARYPDFATLRDLMARRAETEQSMSALMERARIRLLNGLRNSGISGSQPIERNTSALLTVWPPTGLPRPLERDLLGNWFREYVREHQELHIIFDGRFSNIRTTFDGLFFARGRERNQSRGKLGLEPAEHHFYALDVTDFGALTYWVHLWGEYVPAHNTASVQTDLMLDRLIRSTVAFFHLCYGYFRHAGYHGFLSITCDLYGLSRVECLDIAPSNSQAKRALDETLSVLQSVPAAGLAHSIPNLVRTLAHRIGHTFDFAEACETHAKKVLAEIGPPLTDEPT